MILEKKNKILRIGLGLLYIKSNKQKFFRFALFATKLGGSIFMSQEFR